MNTNTPWRTFSIFISSTFADMQAERDHLKNIVFPRIEEELRKKRIRLETVDLRWGVDTTSVNEDEREATVLKVCLEEIERCKPFFIGLLGDRYGWVPLEERIENATSGRKLLLPNKGKSVTALEIEFGVLASTEQMNRSIFYLRKPLPYDKLSPEKVAKFSDQYDPSITLEEKRIRKEALDNLKKAIKSHFNRINLPGKVKSYSVNLNYESGAMSYSLEKWGEMVFADILAECEKHAEDTWGETPKDQYEQEMALMEAFIEEHTHITITITEKGKEQVHTFCGREKLIEELKEHLLSNDMEKWGLVLTGESGSGKTAVFSMMYKEMLKENCLVLAHTAGISAVAKSVTELLRKWNRQLREFLGIKEEKEVLEEETVGIAKRHLGEGDIQKSAPRTGIEELQDQFNELLWKASKKKRIVLMIDALDRFEPTPGAEYMTWLPQTLPVNVKLLVTAITGTEKNAIQYHKAFLSRSIGHFTQEEASEMLYSLGKKQHKRLPKAVEKEILEREREDGLKACSSPLWLSLAVNILMAMDADDFERMSGLKGKGDDQINSYMLEMVKQFPALPGELFLDLIKRAGRIFGESFTTTLFNFIACSRGGLRESDLEALVPRQTSQIWDSLAFANLRRWFKVHLVEHGEGHQWNLGHSILQNSLKEKMELINIKELHVLISSHLLSLPATDALKQKETMFHLMQPDDKIQAIEYYTSELDNESLIGATNILSEVVTSNEKGLAAVGSLPNLLEDRKEILPVLLSRFVYNLNDNLAEAGNHDKRLKLLDDLYAVIEKCYCDQIQTCDFGSDLAALYERLGEIHQEMGHMEEALKYFEKRSSLGEELSESNPRNGYLKDCLAISYEKLGEIHQEMGHMEEAFKYFEKRSAIAEELYESNPRNESLKRGLAISYEKLGVIQKDTGHMEEALKYFEKCSAIGEELYDSNPRNDSLKDGLAISYLKLGEIHQEMGQIQEARKYFEMAFKLAEELYESNPQNESRKDRFAFFHVKLGEIHKEMGHMEEALKYFEQFYQLAKELFESNKMNESLKKNLALADERLGYIHRSMGHMEEALKYFEQFNQLTKELYESNTMNESLKNNLAIAYERLGDIHQSMGHMEEALKYFEFKLKFNQELCKTNPSSEKNKFDLTIANERLAIIHQSMGHMEEALKYFEKDLELTKELYESNPRKESLKDSLAISYQDLGGFHFQMGHLNEALKYVRIFNQLEIELYEDNPKNEAVKRHLAISYEKLGDIYFQMDLMDEALICYDKRSELSEELYEANPISEFIKEGLANSYDRLGITHQSMGHLEEALKYFKKNNQLESELIAGNPHSELLKKDLAISFARLGEILQVMGQFEGAIKYFDEAVKLFKELYESNRWNINFMEGLGVTYKKLSMIYKALGKDENGMEYFLQWKNIISFLVNNLPQLQRYKDWENLEY